MEEAVIRGPLIGGSVSMASRPNPTGNSELMIRLPAGPWHLLPKDLTLSIKRFSTTCRNCRLLTSISNFRHRDTMAPRLLC